MYDFFIVLKTLKTEFYVTLTTQLYIELCLEHLNILKIL